MTILEKIIGTIKNNKMTLENKISYLKILTERGIDLNNIDDDYISPENIIVKKVINNIKKYYNKNKLTVRQIIECEKMNIDFDKSDKTQEDKIEFLKKAILEGINLNDITSNRDNYKNTSILQFIDDLRADFEKNLLTEEQAKICINKLKIILSTEEKQEFIKEKIKESALKNILLNDKTRKILEQ